MLFSKIGIHPFIFSLLPITLIFIDNLTEIPLDDLFEPLLLSVTFAIIPWLVIMRFVGEKKSGLIISLIVILLIIFAHIRGFLIYNDVEEIRFIAKNLILIPIFMSFAFFGIVYIIRKKISPDITSIANVVSIAIISVMFMQAAFFYTNNIYSFEIAEESLNVPVLHASDTAEKPDVYFLVLDAYSGDIILKNDFGYDNSEFNKQLKNRGFFVQERSFSNYPNTELSMPSIMNMAYLDSLSEILGENSTAKSLTRQIWNENKAMQVFKANEYDILTFHGRLGTASNMVTDRFCTSAFDVNPELLGVFINMYFPISSIRTQLLDDKHYDIIKCVFSTVINFDKNTENPLYMHIHVRFPHQPFVFDSDGNKVQDPISVARFDNELKDAYLGQLIFANKKTIELVDSIQNRDPESVIIIMSDHGSRLGVNWNEPTETDYYRALNNISAFYFPGKENYFPMDIAAVNTFRIFFNLYFETDYEILEDRQIWYAPSKPFYHIDITDKIGGLSIRN